MECAALRFDAPVFLSILSSVPVLGRASFPEWSQLSDHSEYVYWTRHFDRVDYDEEEQLKCVFYTRNAQGHRIDGPAVIANHYDCDKATFVYAAMIDYTSERLAFIYKQYDLMHREDGPARIWSCGCKEWFVDNERHRMDGPAVRNCSGQEEWYYENELHRINGPARVFGNGREEWYRHGVLHRVGGPAVVGGPSLDGGDHDDEYWVAGKRMRATPSRRNH